MAIGADADPGRRWRMLEIKRVISSMTSDYLSRREEFTVNVKSLFVLVVSTISLVADAAEPAKSEGWLTALAESATFSTGARKATVEFIAMANRRSWSRKLPHQCRNHPVRSSPHGTRVHGGLSHRASALRNPGGSG